MPVAEIIILILLGLTSGLLVGLLGIGGGVVTVPAFLYLFSHYGYHQNAIMHYSIGTSLAIIVVSSIVAVYVYHNKSGIMWRFIGYLMPGLIVGSITGCIIAFYLSGETLKLIFGIFVIILGIYMFFTKELYLPIYAPKNVGFSFYGIIIGCISTMLGIGGGVIAMPFLIMIFKTPRKVLIGTASVCTLFSSIAGVLTYIVLGFEAPYLVKNIGFIDFPVFLIVSIVSIFSVFLGVKLSQKTPTEILRKIFAVALTATGISMIM